MGRKIPAKRHRGVKDPLQQQAKRLENLKGKINAPPKDPDEQPMPRSLIRLFGLSDPNKKDNKKKVLRKARNLESKDKGVHVGSNPISRLRKLPGESGRGFSLRINSAIRALHGTEENLEYPQDLEAEDYKGQQMSEQRERRAKKRRRAERAAGAGDALPGERLSRTQKLALKKKAKKIKTLEARDERREVEYERVAFGDVTHAPPALPAGAAPRPGRRGLLLCNMLAPGGPSASDAADLRRRERARLDAVAAYRALKANRHKHK